MKDRYGYILGADLRNTTIPMGPCEDIMDEKRESNQLQRVETLLSATLEQFAGFQAEIKTDIKHIKSGVDKLDGKYEKLSDGKADRLEITTLKWMYGIKIAVIIGLIGLIMV